MAEPITSPGLPAELSGALAAGPATFDLGRTVGELHGAKEPVTWAGASVELAERPQRPASALQRSPTERKWMRWAVGGSVAMALTLGLVASFVSDDEPEPIPEAAAAEADLSSRSGSRPEFPTAPEEPPPAPAVVPPPEPEKKSKKAKRDSTLAAAKPATSQPAASKPGAGKSSKPASSTPPKPTPSNPKPTPGPLAPPDEESPGSKAELPDVEGWDDHDAVAGDRDAE